MLVIDLINFIYLVRSNTIMAAILKKIIYNHCYYHLFLSWE